MLKSELIKKLEIYEKLLSDIGRWANPQSYRIENSEKNTLIFHINGIKETMDKFYEFQSKGEIKWK